MSELKSIGSENRIMPTAPAFSAKFTCNENAESECNEKRGIYFLRTFMLGRAGRDNESNRFCVMEDLSVNVI